MMDGGQLYLPLFVPSHYHPSPQMLITPDKSEDERVNDIFTVVKQEKTPHS